MTTNQRLTERLVQYWKLIAGENKFPEIQQLNTATIQDVWAQCFMVSVDTHGSITYKYEYMGEAIIKAYGNDMTGMIASNKIKQFPGSVVIDKLGEVLVRQTFLTDEGHLLNQEGRMIKYRACFLPFGNDKKGVTHIVVGLSFRVF